MKNNFESIKNLYKNTISCLLTFAIAYIFWKFWNEYFNGMMDRNFLGKGNILIILIYSVILILFFRGFNAYKIGYFKINNVILSQVLALICTNIIIYLQIILMIGNVNKLEEVTVRGLEMTFLDVIICFVLTFILNRFYFMLFPPYRILEIYGDHKNNLRSKLGTRSDKYILENSVHISEGIDSIQQKLPDYDAVLLNDIPTEIKNILLKFCFQNSIRVYFTPKISDILVKTATEINVFDTPLFLNRNIGLSFASRIVKRSFDILISLIGILISAPITLATALCIKLEDKGAIFYCQERCTINGKHFQIYKFRSMLENAEKSGGAQLAKANDSRITRVGGFIRKTRIDELPQLINVLKGDMSLVGPRPERPEFIAENIRKIPEFAYRTKVKAGLTGYAQVYGKYNTSFLDKLKLDLLYIEKQSIYLDLKILVMTIKVIFMKESTEGV